MIVGVIFGLNVEKYDVGDDVFVGAGLVGFICMERWVA